MDGAEIVQVAAADPRGDPRPARAGLHRPADAGHAPRRPVRPADHQPVPPLGRQPARRPDARPRRQSAGILDGRYNVSFEDVRRVYLPALRHRVILNFEAQAEGIDSDQVLLEILEKVPEKADK